MFHLADHFYVAHGVRLAFMKAFLALINRFTLQRVQAGVIIYPIGILMNHTLDARFRVRLILIGIVLATLPCYCTGLVMVQLERVQAGLPTATQSPTVTTSSTASASPTQVLTTTATIWTPTMTATVTVWTPTVTATGTQTLTPTNTLLPTQTATAAPTQTAMPTMVPPTFTPTLPPPTAVNTPTLTPTPTIGPLPSVTPGDGGGG
jgi:hypothetical protein